jgi:DNA-binding HxlR family transcriptional regulator
MTEKPAIRRSPVPLRLCNLARSFELIGDRWTLLILRSAMYGVRRFDDFQADLDVPRSVLSNRLAGLVESGIMERREYREEGQRARVEYPLTRMGYALGLPFMAMTEWGDAWLGEPPSPVSLRAKATVTFRPVAFVDDSGRAVKPAEVETVIDTRAVKAAERRR